MALTLIHQFTSSLGVTYTILYDSDTNTTTTQISPEGEPESFVTEAELGRNQDELYNWLCDDGNKISFYATTNYPFVTIQTEINSSSCVYLSPYVCVLDHASFNVTAETQAGLHDGMVVMDVSFGDADPLKYSLDNLNWQSSNTFIGLMPGTYNGYARSPSKGCLYTAQFTIAAGAEAVEPEIPWQEKLCHFFQLKIDNVIYPVEEPGKWDQVSIIGKRDKDWHGWLWSYSDGKVDLEFDCAAGKEIIEAEYAIRGSDAEIFFTYGFTATIGTTTYTFYPFEGKLNLNTRKLFPSKIVCSVERSDHNELFQTRFDSKVTMTSDKTVDGATITPPSIEDIALHAKEIVRNFKVDNSTPMDLAGQIFTMTPDGKFFIMPDTLSAVLTEIEEGFTYPLQVSKLKPYEESKYNWKVKFAGTYTFSFNFVIKYTMERSAVGSAGTGGTIKHFLRINGVETQFGATTTFPALSTTVPAVLTVSAIGSFPDVPLQVDDEVFLYSELDFAGQTAAFGIALQQVSSLITVSALERAAASTAKGWFIFNAIDHAIRTITENRTWLKSTFLSRQHSLQPTDGPGSLFITTNGKQIRKFEPATSPLQVAAKELLNSVKAIWCLGLGFERSAGNELVRVERVNYFYQNREILVIEEPFEYREETAKDLLYNEVEIGYEKFQAEGYNTLDEFNTKHEYVTPIKTNKLKLLQKSNLIASGYAIEDSRRQQFAATATNSYKNDDDPFIIAMTRVNASEYIPEKDEAFLTVNNLISPETSYNLRLSPKRMLLNWAIWLRNVFHFKVGTDKIKNTFVTQNGLLETQFQPTEPAPVGDINRDLWKEGEEVDLTNYEVEERLWRPEWIHFKAKLTADKVDLINKSLKGAKTSATNYGYVVVKDKSGLYQAGWPYELEYNYSKEVATFKLLKKHDSPVTPGAACCDELVVNACYLKVNGQRLIV